MSIRPVLLSAFVWLLALGCLSDSGREPAPEERALRFVERTAGAGLDFEHVSGSPEQRYILESMSSGAVFFDADGDDDQDLFLVNSSRVAAHPAGVGNRFYRNVPAPDGGRAFEDATPSSGLGRGGWGMGAAAGDTDNDGDVDLYVTYWGENVLYESGGDGRFTDVTAAAGAGDPGWGTSAAFGDLDGDGLLDLFVANYLVFDLDDPPGGGLPCSGWRGLDVYCGPQGLEPQANVLYRNEGSGRFSDRSRESGVSEHREPSLGVVLGDYDDDGDQDLYVANDGYPNVHYRNDGGWRLTEVAARAGTAYSEDGRLQAGMGVASADYDGDGDLDLFVTNFSDDVNTLYQNQGGGRFRDHTGAAGLAAGARPFLGWSTAFFDADGDGWLDLFVANGHIYPQVDMLPSGTRYAQRNLLYRNLGGRFRPVDGGPGMAAVRVSRGAALADYDNDGDTDLLVVNLNGPPELLHNSGQPRHWLGLRLRGRGGNRDALGARVRLHSGALVQTREVQRAVGYLSQSDPRLLFGLGDGAPVDSVVVRWPGGRRQVLRGLTPGRYHVVEEGVPGPVASYAGSDTLSFPVGAEALAASAPAPDAAYDPGSGGTVEEHYRRGRELYDQGRYEEAVAAFRWLVERHPDFLPARYSLAVGLYSAMGRIDEARVVLEQIVAIDSTRAEAFRLLGVVHMSQDRPRAAVSALERAVALDPADGDAHTRLGLALVRLGDLQTAEAAFRQAARVAPWRPQPHLHLADLLEGQGRSREAGEHRRTFDRLRPAEEAVRRARRQVREFSADARLHYRLGLAYLAQARYGAAAGSFGDALGLDSTFAAAHHGLGAAHHLRGELAAAVDAYRRATRWDPQRLAGHADLAQACMEARRFAEAVSALDAALRLDPERLELRTRRGLAAALAGRLEDGLGDLRTVLQADPSRVDNRVALAEVYAMAGRLPEAAEQWEAVLRLDAAHPAAGVRLRELRERMAGR